VNLNFLIGVATLTGINLMAVLGLSLMTGFTGLFSFGHAAFMAIGAYTSAILMMNFGVPFYITILAAGAAAAIIASLVGRLTLKLRGDYFCIATLGFGEAIRLIFDNMNYFGGARGLPGIPRHTTLGLVVLVNIVGILVLVSLIKSKYGRNMKAIREEELASRTIGIDVFAHKIISFMIAAFYAGVAGALFASYTGFLQPLMFNLVRSTELTIMVIFGGIGSISGSVLGTVVLFPMPEILRGWFANWRLVIYGALVVFIIVVRPEGLMGGKEFSDLFRKLRSKRKAVK